MEVEIPEDVEQKLKDLDAKEQEQIEKEQQELRGAESETRHDSNPEGLERWWAGSMDTEHTSHTHHRFLISQFSNIVIQKWIPASGCYSVLMSWASNVDHVE